MRERRDEIIVHRGHIQQSRDSLIFCHQKLEGEKKKLRKNCMPHGKKKMTMVRETGGMVFGR